MKKSIVTAAVAIATLSLIYIETKEGQLFSVKPTDFNAVQKNPKLLASCNLLKHNPTCIFVVAGRRKSTEDARPIYFYDGKLFAKQVTIAEPAKVTKAIAGGKTIKVVSDGPQTFYISAEGDTRPFSVDAEGFTKFQENPEMAAKFATRLKHNPTCVSVSLDRGLVSSEDERRPMYRIVKNKLVRHYSTEAAEKAATAKATPVAKVSKEKAPSKKEARAAKEIAKVATPSEPIVDQAIPETATAPQENEG